MGSSAKRRKEKKKDFQKPKLRVGKAKPKPDNHTDTSFRARAIVLNQQSLNVSAPSTTHQFQHHVSLLSARSDSQRKESLSYLTSYVSSHPVNLPLPMPTGGLLDKVLPLVLDGSNPVRVQALKLMQSLKAEAIRDHAAKLLPFVRAGMTHLSKDIRTSAVDTLAWSLSIAGEELVSCAGGWFKTLDSFVTLLGWKSLQDSNSWSSSKASFGNESKAKARIMQVLDAFLRSGLEQVKISEASIDGNMALDFPLWFADTTRPTTTSDAFLRLNLFGNIATEGKQILEDRTDRLQVFDAHFRGCVVKGVEAAKGEGGELGRAAGMLNKTLRMVDMPS